VDVDVAVDARTSRAPVEKKGDSYEWLGRQDQR